MLVNTLVGELTYFELTFFWVITINFQIYFTKKISLLVCFFFINLVASLHTKGQFLWYAQLFHVCANQFTRLSPITVLLSCSTHSIYPPTHRKFFVSNYLIQPIKCFLQFQPPGLQSRGTSYGLHHLRTFGGAQKAAGGEYFSWHPFHLWIAWSRRQCALPACTLFHSNYRLHTHIKIV